MSYAVAPGVLTPHLPSGCELDTINGDAFVSLVAFDFLDTRVLGIPWPGFRNFPEINLRFYVRHNNSRGVCFIREFVPQPFVAWCARAVYNEPYVAAKMSSSIRRIKGDTTLYIKGRVPFIWRGGGDVIEVEHRMTFNGTGNHLRVTADAQTITPPPTSREHFFKEHSWGFGQSRSGRLIRYQVEHPEWAIHPVLALDLQWNFAAVYGEKWKFLADQQPVSTILAAGSAVKVFPKLR